MPSKSRKKITKSAAAKSAAAKSPNAKSAAAAQKKEPTGPPVKPDGGFLRANTDRDKVYNHKELRSELLSDDKMRRWIAERAAAQDSPAKKKQKIEAPAAGAGGGLSDGGAAFKMELRIKLVPHTQSMHGCGNTRSFANNLYLLPCQLYLSVCR